MLLQCLLLAIRSAYTYLMENNTTITINKSKKYNSTITTTQIETTEIRGFNFSKVVHDFRVQRYDALHFDAGSTEEYFWASNEMNQIVGITKLEYAQLIAGE